MATSPATRSTSRLLSCWRSSILSSWAGAFGLQPFALPRAYRARAFPLPCLARNPSEEEVRDGSHADNRGRGNRGGLSPTALRLLRIGAATAGPCTTLEAASVSIRRGLRSAPVLPLQGA